MDNPSRRLWRTCQAWPIRLAEWSLLTREGWRGPVAFVWPDEGRWTDKGNWIFNKAHRGQFEPLIIPYAVAGTLRQLHAGLRPTSRQRFEEMIAGDRATFCVLIDTAWNSHAGSVVNLPSE